MKSKIILSIIYYFIINICSAQVIQGSIQKGSGNSVDVWLKPDFSNSTEYLFQIGLPIAFPASDNAAITDLTVTLDAGFTSAFGNNYSVGIAPQAHNTSNSAKYYFIYLVRGGSGASNAQTWTSGTAFKVCNISFSYTGSVDTAKIKLADFQDGGSDGLGNFYTVDGNANYYVTSNSVNNFYAITSQSATGGNSSEGYAETLDSVIISARGYIVNNETPKDPQTALVSIYPNPATDQVTVRSKEKIQSVDIIDLSGNLLKHINASAAIINVDISTLRPGLYNCKVFTGDGKAEYLKFIKQ